FGEQIFDFTKSKFQVIRTRQVAGYGKFFQGVRPTGTDLIIFTITARPILPITDVLYLSFLRWALTSGLTKKIIVIVWFDRKNDDGEGWEQYRSFLMHCFEGCEDRLVIVDGARARAEDDDAPVPELFWRALDQLTSAEYYRWIANLGIRARTLRHMNRARPGDIVLRGLVAHTMQNAHAVPGVINGHVATLPIKREVILSVLFWELEVDRLAVYYELYSRGKENERSVKFSLNPIRGRTIRARRQVAADNHSADLAIGLALPLAEQLRRLDTKSRQELRGYVEALRIVLQENYGFSVDRAQWVSQGKGLVNEWRTAERIERLPRLGRLALQVIFLLHEMRRKWEAQK
ncbi:MAG: hypothetical protein ACREUM_04765, partial [Nitrosospira sp.]